MDSLALACESTDAQSQSSVENFEKSFELIIRYALYTLENKEGKLQQPTDEVFIQISSNQESGNYTTTLSNTDPDDDPDNPFIHDLDKDLPENHNGCSNKGSMGFMYVKEPSAIEFAISSVTRTLSRWANGLGAIKRVSESKEGVFKMKLGITRRSTKPTEESFALNAAYIASWEFQ